MATSIKLGSDTYLDATGVELHSSSASLRKTLEEATTVTDSVYTSNVDTTYVGTNHAINIFGYGRIRIMRYNINTLSAFPSGITTLQKLVAGSDLLDRDKPHTDTNFNVAAQNGNATIRITSSGGIDLGLVNGGSTWVRGTVTYISAS